MNENTDVLTEDFDTDLDILEDEQDIYNEESETSSTPSSDIVNRIVEDIASGLSDEDILDLINETDIKHKTSGIDGSYKGTMVSEDKISDLLHDIDVPTDIKTETVSHGNILNISNYSDFLLLQSRLTGVPFNTLVNGLKIFEEGVQEQQLQREQDRSYEFEEEAEVVNESVIRQSNMVEGIDTEEDEVISMKFEDEAPKTIFDLEEGKNEEEFDLSDLDIGIADSSDTESLSEDLQEDEEEFDINEEEDEEEEEEELEITPSLSAKDYSQSFNLELNEMQIEDNSEDFTEGTVEIKAPVNLEKSMEDTQSEEVMQVAPIDAIRFNNNKNKVNKSKTYALHTIQAGGNYNV